METRNYETKCRRCGNISEWSGLPKEKSTEKSIKQIKYFHDLVINPRQYDCDVCEKRTVQDVVSYDDL